MKMKMKLKRIWPKLLIISSVIVILCFLVFLKAVLDPTERYIEARKYDDIYWFLILLSIVVSSTIAIGCAKLLKKPLVLFAIPLFSQFIALGLIIPYKEWSPYLPGGAEFGWGFYFTSLFFFWIGGSLLAAILYGLCKKRIEK